MSIEGITLEHFSAFTKGRYQYNCTIMSTPRSISLLLSDDSKHDAATTTVHSKRLISFLKEKKLLSASLSTIWENTDGCAEQYICTSALYLVSVMYQCY